MPPLQPQLIQVPLGGGVDTVTDPKLLPLGKVTNVVNGVYDQFQSVRVRTGFDGFGQTTFASGSSASSLPASRGLATFADEIDFFGQDGCLYSFSPAVGEWARIDHVSPCYGKRTTIQTGAGYGAYDGSFAVVNGLRIVAWIRVSSSFSPGTNYQYGDLYWAVYDDKTGGIVLPPAKLSGAWNGNVVLPKLMAVGNNVVLSWSDQSADNLYVMSILAGASAVPSVSVAPTKKLTGTGAVFYDVATDGTNCFLFACNTSNTLTVVEFSPSTLTTGSINTTHSVNSFSSAFVVSVYFIPGSTNLFWVGTSNEVCQQIILKLSGSSITNHTSIVNLDTHILQSGTVLDNSNVQMAAAFDPISGSLWVVWTATQQIEDALSNVLQNFVTYAQPYRTGDLSPLAPPKRANGCELVGQPFAYGSRVIGTGSATNVYAPMVYASSGNFQNSTYLVDVRTDLLLSASSMEPACSVAVRDTFVQQFAYFDRSAGTLSNTLSNGGVWRTLGQATLDAATGQLSLLDFDFSSVEAPSAVEFEDNLQVATGTPSYYDGSQVAEIGFCAAPDPVVLQYAASGGAMAAGTYLYQFVWEWTDAYGNIHRSEPSIQQAVDVAADGGAVYISVGNLPFTRRAANGAAVHLVVYRSTANSTLLQQRYIEGIASILTPWTPDNISYSFNDGSPDSDIGEGISLDSQPFIYTDGGVTPNQNPPSSRYSCVHKRRVWLAGCDDPKRVYYSQQNDELLTAVGFNDDYSFVVDDGGDVTGILGMDDELCVFKEDRIFTVGGQGPNQLGQNNDLSDPVRVASDVGCSDYRSLVLTPDGIMFRSLVGINILGRDLSVQDVGFPINGYLSTYPIVTSALMDPTRSQVRFACSKADGSAGIVLVYDTLTKAWTTSQLNDYLEGTTTSPVASAVPFENAYCWASPAGGVYQETVGLYLDGTQFVPLTVETPWVQVSDVAGYQKLWRVALVGTVLDPADVTVSLAYDYESAYTQSYTWTAASLAALNDYPNLMLEMHVSRSKCGAVRVKVSTSTPTGASATTGQGISFERVVLKLGAMPGLRKLPPSARQ